MTESSPRERLLDVAERLFSEHGYVAVTLRDIAAELGIRQASLYHHVPGGKENLYVEVMERGLARHRAGLEAAIARGATIELQLRGAARWLLSHPSINLNRMARSDMPAISEANASRLLDRAFSCLLVPLGAAMEAAQARGEAHVPLPFVVAGGFLSFIDGLWNIPDHRPAERSREELADEFIRIVLDGVRPRGNGKPAGAKGATE